MSNREAITAEYTRKLHDEITDLKQKLIEMQGGCAPYILLKEATLNLAMRKLEESYAREEKLRDALQKAAAHLRPTIGHAFYSFLVDALSETK